jgi:hypothetical protein
MKTKTLSKEKQEWMKQIGMKEFHRPMKYYLGANCLFSEEYIRETPLEELKAKTDLSLVEEGELHEN